MSGRVQVWLASALLAIGMVGWLALPAAAQEPAGCTAEAEPNDSPDALPILSGPLCITGTLPTNDQDIVVWELSVADAARPWTIAVDGIPGTITGLKILPVTSDPGVVPVIAGSQVLEVSSPPDATGPVTPSDVLLPPGRLLLGISRSEMADGGQPSDLGYRFSLEPGQPLPSTTEVEPNDDAGTATAVDGAFAIAGDAAGSRDELAWTLPETPSGQGWTVRLAGTVGVGLSVSLLAEDGSEIASARQGPDGTATLADLVLPAGRWDLLVSGAGDSPTAYGLNAVQGPLDGDAEPNDRVGQELLIDPAAGPVKGRLWPADDRDRYRLVIPEGATPVLRDFKLLGGRGIRRSLCLEGPDGSDLQCRDGTGGVALRSLDLRPGTYALRITGDASPDHGYVLRIDETASPAADFEAEPNDAPLLATAWDSSITMHGLGSGDDTDVFRLAVAGEPQLWEIRVQGTGVGRLAWIKADWTALAEGGLSDDRTNATLTDLYLVPGTQLFRVEGGGDYTLTATPLGPPDPNAEREPNNDAAYAEPYRLDRTDLIGRLPNANDNDVFRFTLAADERVILTATPPSDGAVDLEVDQEGQLVSGKRATGVGVPTRLELLLEPGDYEVWVQPSTPSLGRYHLTLERGVPFPVRADEEPNDAADQARPLPATLAVEGTLADADGDDWYALPPIDPATPLTITTQGDVWSIEVTDGTTDVPLTPDPTTEGMLTSDGTSGVVPRFLRVSGTGDYTFRLSGPGLDPSPAPPPLAVSATLTPSTDRVAAYWPSGQHLTADLSLSNDGSSPVDLALDAHTSHFAWTAVPQMDTVHLDPGASASVPVDVLVGPDAWAGEPVLITLRAATADGGWASAAATVTPRGDADPVAPEQRWSVPDALLGGLDVASLALGATTLPAYDQTMEDQLHDGFTHTGMGFSEDISLLPVTLTVDLAGDAPVPVAGFILNPQAAAGINSAVPRDVTLLLSTDGATFTPAMSVRLSTLMADQSFVLPEPVPATFAQLRIDSARGGGFGDVSLGEWKVIATPGFTPSADPIDLAQPIRGGHVAWTEPQPVDETTPSTWLDEATDATQLYLEKGAIVTWVVGFHDDRAAQVTSLGWIDPVPSTPGQRFEEVTVEGSLEGAGGPWEPLGTWTLTRADDGTVAPFTFSEPTWVRFLRFTGHGPRREAAYWDVPGGLHVNERPTDASYRSVLGEWGAGEPVGPFEWLQPPDLSLPPVVADANDTADTAQPIEPGSSTNGKIDTRTDEDWYTFTVPDGQNSIDLTVAGKPIVAVALTLYDDTGLEVPMLFAPGDTPGTVQYAAEVESGRSYRLKVVQPPSSIVFTFDTSGSMGPYLDYVYQAMRAFTADVTKGEEFVSIVPFEEDPLLDEFSDDAWALQDAVSRYTPSGGSSSAEAALINATTALSAREGAKAVLMVTDAETSSFQRQTELWGILSAVRPLVFGVHVGATGAPPISTGYMQDWAGQGGGFYQYTRSHGEMDRAFDRLATWLRRPANYRLDLATSFQEQPPESAKPGTISVASPADGSVTLSPDVGVEIILDTSGSMLKEIKGERRIDLAKQVLADLVTNRLPAGAPVAVRILGDVTGKDVCGTSLIVPLRPLDPASVVAKVTGIDVIQATDTPLGQALRAVPDDLAGSAGTRIVLLITDSEEVWPNPDLCGEDPAAAVKALRGRGIDARLNIVGLQVASKKASKQLKGWARAGNGSYFTAKDADTLGRSIRTAVSAPFRILDQNGNEVASGTVDGDPVAVKPGTYSVVVLSDPVQRFDGVDIKPGGSASLQLPDAPPAPSLEPLPSTGP
ncbi:MAG: VWA domain-containing protein [Chloroflexota bacterium]